MPRMTGRVDGARRPLLRLAVMGGEPMLVLVDTGFNGELWLT
jgi:predicted aspartyl protease